jgi:DNA-binding transcriptional LysR family regulator
MHEALSAAREAVGEDADLERFTEAAPALTVSVGAFFKQVFMMSDDPAERSNRPGPIAGSSPESLGCAATYCRSMSSVFTLSSLRVFAAAAKHLNFSRAASELELTQPYVSAQISALERRLGVELFDRLPARGVRLTEAGALLVRHARTVVCELAAAEDELAALAGRIGGRMRLAASTTPGGYVLPGILTAFSRSHPGVQVSLTVGSAYSVEQAVLSGDADIGVLAGLMVSDRLVTTVVGSAESVLVVPAQHPWAGRPAIQPANLEGVRLLQRQRGSSTRAQVERELRRAGVTPRETWEFDDIDAIKHAVVAGLGVAVLSTLAVRWEVAAGLLATVRIGNLELTQDIQAVLLGSKRHNAAASAFMALLRGERAANPPIGERARGRSHR